MIGLGALPAAVVLRCGAVALIVVLLGIALWRTSKLVEAEKRVCTPSRSILGGAGRLGLRLMPFRARSAGNGAGTVSCGFVLHLLLV
jgi:hypothetical protein